MCHEWSMRRERRREERFDEELQHLLDEKPAYAEPPQPMVEKRDKEPSDPERGRLEAATRP